MHVLVTGGAGFIGGHLAEAFLSDGHDVTVLGAMNPFYDLSIKEHTLQVHRDAAETAGVDYEFVEGDVRDADLVSELVEDAGYIYHQAAKAGVRPQVRRPPLVGVNETRRVSFAHQKSSISGDVTTRLPSQRGAYKPEYATLVAESCLRGGWR